MAVLSRKQLKFFDRLFFEAPALEKAVAELRAEAAAAAAQSVDPTGREAVVNVAPVKAALIYDDPEAWLQVVSMTWERYHAHTDIGKAMRRRYRLHESPERTSAMIPVGVETYYRWRKEFLIVSALYAATKKLKF